MPFGLKLGGAGERGFNGPEIVKPGDDVEVSLEPTRDGKSVVTVFGARAEAFKTKHKESGGSNQVKFREFNLDPQNPSAPFLSGNVVSIETQGDQLSIRNLSNKNKVELLTLDSHDMPKQGEPGFDPKHGGWRKKRLESPLNQRIAGQEELVGLDKLNGNLIIKVTANDGNEFELVAHTVKTEGDKNTACFRLVGPER